MRILLYPLILAFIILGCGLGDSFLATPPPTSIPRSPSKQVVDSGLPLQEIWRWSGTIDSGPMITFANDKIIFASWKREGYIIQVMDAQTGNSIWESAPIRNLSSLHVDNHRVYVGTIQHVQAYDIESGKVLWEGAKQPMLKRGGLFVYPNGEYLDVYDFIGGKLYILSVETGETLDVVERSQIMLRKNEDFYSLTCVPKYCYFSLSNPSKNRLWQNKFDGLPRIWPVFIDNLVYVGTNTGIYAINIESGNVIWQAKSKYVTNISTDNDLIYAISEDASIVGLDSKKGQVIGKIKVEPSRTHQDDQELGYDTFYNISASDKYVAAYYDNSGELIIFEIER